MDEQGEPLRSLDQAWRVITRDALNPSAGSPSIKLKMRGKEQPTRIPEKKEV